MYTAVVSQATPFADMTVLRCEQSGGRGIHQYIIMGVFDVLSQSYVLFLNLAIASLRLIVLCWDAYDNKIQYAYIIVLFQQLLNK